MTLAIAFIAYAATALLAVHEVTVERPRYPLLALGAFIATSVALGSVL